jgi:NAD(P)-dependent dehydrogenase (short-subunit alcohol dehydrogenase family)
MAEDETAGNDAASTDGRLRGETAIVTGSSGRGLGTEIARVFARAGAQVVVTGRDTARGHDVVRGILEVGGTAHFVRADLTSEDDCAGLVAETVEVFGAPTVLVNNAVADGFGPNAAVGELTTELWERTMLVNVTAPMWLCRSAIPHMIAAGHGSIVMINSRAVLRANRRLAAYIASKGALQALARSISMDYAPLGIRCNSVFPGWIDTKERDTDSDESRARIEASRTRALGAHLTRLPTVEDVSYAALYFASRESESVTGAELVVDGGGSIARGLTLG